MGKENKRNFYAELPLLDSFLDATDPSRFNPLPDEWFIAVTDIENSTEAVKSGNYKSVNIVGASSIIGMLNACDRTRIPFTFGGDGCAICIPADLCDTARQVMEASREIGRTAYGLNLRAALIPVRIIREAGYDIQVARFKVSDYYAQAVFRGGGLSYAEELLKSDEPETYHIEPGGKNTQTVSFEGLECRWQEVGQKQKKVMTLLVQASPKLENKDVIYQKVLRRLEKIFDFDRDTNPVNVDALSMHFSLKELMKEVKFRSFGMNILQRLLYLLKVEVEVMLGKIFMKLGYKTSATDWSLYKTDLVKNSDHRKFDDILRLVISGTEEECAQMQNYLRQEHEASRLAYGIHLTDKAVVTCMVFRYHREHIHFVDGSEGGYIQASKMLKRQVERLQ